jgi:hypothetical protein
MLKKVGQLVLAVTKWLLALSLCSLVSSLPPLAPNLLDLEVVDETHEMVSRYGLMEGKSICVGRGGCVEDI